MLLIAALVLATIAGAMADPCAAPYLPTDLDLIGAVERQDTGELHLHGEYRLGGDDFVKARDGQVRTLKLKYDEATELRVSLSPDERIRMSLYLYAEGTTAPVAESTHGGWQVERMIFAVLKAKQAYRLEYVYNLGFDVDERCPTVVMELAAQPKAQAKVFHDACQEDGAGRAPRLGLIVPQQSDSGRRYYKYRSPTVYAFVGGADEGHEGEHELKQEGFFKELARYTMAVPLLPTSHQRWKLRVAIHANFLDGGDVAAVVTASNKTKSLRPADCADGHEQCLYGARALRNTFILEDTIDGGGEGRMKASFYRLWLVLRSPEASLARTCVPYQFTVDLFPVASDETFVSCEYQPLPPTMHLPGLYDNATAVLRTQGAYLLNLSKREHATFLQPTKDSVLRALLGDHSGVDIDLLVYDITRSSKLVASSMALRGPEGIVAPLTKGHLYKISVVIPAGFRRYSSADHDFVEFCDHFRLELHTFPTTDAKDEQCAKRPPSLSGIQQRLNASKPFVFGFDDSAQMPFSHPLALDAAIGQETILTQRIYAPTTLSMMFVVSSDACDGTPQVVLEMDGTPDRLYSRPRAVGAGLWADVEEGWYTVRVVTPYVQSTSQSWHGLLPTYPGCIKYNLHVEVRRPENSNCMFALPLPAELTESPHRRSHLRDDFAIPRHAAHRLALSPKVSSVLHVSSDYSDLPLTMKVYDGDDVLTTSSAIKGVWGGSATTLLASLEAGKTYKLGFSFETTNGHRRCAVFGLQLSMVPVPRDTKSECPEREGTVPLGVVKTPLDLVRTQTWKADDDKADLQVTFTLAAEAHGRVLLDYDFTVAAIDLLLCRCDGDKCDSSCATAQMKQANELEIPSTLLRAGKYALRFVPWKHGLPGSAKDLTQDCATMRMRVAFQGVGHDCAPSLCGRMKQYLPTTLNRLGGLSGAYGDEVHFLQQVLINTQHFEDRAAFTLATPSVVRAFVPDQGELRGVVSIGPKGSGLAHTKVAQNFGTAATVQLAAGDYELRIRYYTQYAKSALAQCTAVPLEFSVVRKSSVSKFPEATCEDDTPFPTTMSAHGHTLRHRQLPTSTSDKPWAHTVPFKVGSHGGNLDLDVRYNFAAGPLDVVVKGKQMLDDGTMQAVTFPVARLPNRVFLNTRLKAGQYSLVVSDPATVSAYTRSAHPQCAPYSLHILFADYGSGATVSPAPWQTPAPMTVLPTLSCPDRYDVLPARVRDTEQGTSFTLHGEDYRISFEDGGDRTHQRSGTVYKAVTKTVDFVVYPNEFVRAWIETQADAVFRLELFAANSTERIAAGSFFGFRQQGIMVQPEVTGARLDARLRITAHYARAPEYQRDYTTCQEKMDATTFELFLGVVPGHQPQALLKCRAGQTEKKLPPATVTADKMRMERGLFRFTKDYCKGSDPLVWSTASGSAPHTRAWSSVVTCHYDTHIVVPEDKTEASVAAGLYYNLLTSNFRLSLRYPNGTAVVTDRGNPTSGADELFNAEATVKALELRPGNYVLRVSQALTVPQWRSLAQLCIPFRLVMGLAPHGGHDSGHGGKPTDNGPRVISVQPPQDGLLDPSKSLRIEVTLDTAARQKISWNRPVAYLVDTQTGKSVAPSTHYMPSSTRLASVYMAGSLQWFRNYSVRVDATTLVPADSSKASQRYTVAVPQLPWYRTAQCSCNGLYCVEGGACACTLLDGSTCDRCPAGTALSSTTHLGPAGSAGRDVQLCLKGSAPVWTPTPDTAPVDTPAPWTAPTPRPAGPPSSPRPGPGPTSPPTGGTPAPAGVDKSNTQPPLRWMRVLLSSVALCALLVFAASQLYRLRRRAQQEVDRVNPFRMVATEDPGDDGDDGDNDALVQAEGNPMDPAAATLPPASMRMQSA